MKSYLKISKVRDVRMCTYTFETVQNQHIPRMGFDCIDSELRNNLPSMIDFDSGQMARSVFIKNLFPHNLHGMAIIYHEVGYGDYWIDKKQLTKEQWELERLKFL